MKRIKWYVVCLNITLYRPKEQRQQSECVENVKVKSAQRVSCAFCLSLSSASIRILVPQSVLSALQIPQHRDSSVIPARHQRHPAGVHQAQRLPEVQRRRLLPAKRRAVQLGLRQLQHHLVRDLTSARHTAHFPQLLVLHLFSVTVKRFVVLTAL